MPYKETEDEKLFYSIGEVSRMFNVNPSLIRFWEREFEVLKPHKNKKGNRLFTQDDLDNLKIIFHLVKERGFTLQGAKNKLREDKQSLKGNAEVHKSLEKLKGFLVELKEQL